MNVIAGMPIASPASTSMGSDNVFAIAAHRSHTDTGMRAFASAAAISPPPPDSSRPVLPGLKRGRRCGLHTRRIGCTGREHMARVPSSFDFGTLLGRENTAGAPSRSSAGVEWIGARLRLRSGIIDLADGKPVSLDHFPSLPDGAAVPTVRSGPCALGHRGLLKSFPLNTILLRCEPGVALRLREDAGGQRLRWTIHPARKLLDRGCERASERFVEALGRAQAPALSTVQRRRGETSTNLADFHASRLANLASQYFQVIPGPADGDHVCQRFSAPS